MAGMVRKWRKDPLPTAGCRRAGKFKSKDKAHYVLRKKVTSRAALVETFKFPINFPSGVLLLPLLSQPREVPS